MRNFKFRTWVKKEQKMIFNNRSAMVIKMFTPNYAYLDSEVEVMQNTGLKDRHGKEIYEGDILGSSCGEMDVLKCEVVFKAPSFCRKWLNRSTANLRGRDIEPLAWNTHIIYEVIGNIYENPDLLK
jgi:uncharacterized phage protein (TIGR01671 family)